MIDFIVRIATTENEMSIEEIEEWIIQHTERYDKKNQRDMLGKINNSIARYTKTRNETLRYSTLSCKH